MPGCPNENTVLQLLSGTLDPTLRPTVLQHVQGCGPCLNLMRHLSAAAAKSADQQEGGQEEGADRGALTPGDRLGSYRVVAFLGQGGMSRVYEAFHETLGRRAAIKVLASTLVQDHAARLLTEGRAANVVRHPGVVDVYEIGQLTSGAPYLIMEFLEGQSLAVRLAQEDPQGPAQARALGLQVAQALAVAHERGVIHRDLKPANIMLVPDPLGPCGERAKVLDFGLAKLSETPHRTRSGMIMGTPLYMSPEQCRGAGQIDGQADVYALGCILYEMVAGRPPFLAAESGALLAMHMRDPPPPLSEVAPQLPQDMRDLIMSMLAKEPGLRPTMPQVAAVLSGAKQAASDTAAAPSAQRWASTQRWTRPAFLAGLCALALLFLGRTRGPSGMVHLPGGTFQMGSPPEEIEGAYAWSQRIGCSECSRALYEREGPMRTITLSPFWLDRTEVTNEQFAAWLNTQRGLQVAWGRQVRQGEVLLADFSSDYGYSGVLHQGGRFVARRGLERRPVALVTWHGAQRYCAAQGKALPTEAQWEFAARGTAGYRFPWGDLEPQCAGVVFGRLAGHDCAQQISGPMEVGWATQDRSPQGIYDLGGNVAEWVHDRFSAPYPPCSPPCRDPIEDAGPADVRVVRGGAWFRLAESCRGAGRARLAADQVTGDTGFRCSKTDEPAQKEVR